MPRKILKEISKFVWLKTSIKSSLKDCQQGQIESCLERDGFLPYIHKDLPYQQVFGSLIDTHQTQPWSFTAQDTLIYKNKSFPFKMFSHLTDMRQHPHIMLLWFSFDRLYMKGSKEFQGAHAHSVWDLITEVTHDVIRCRFLFLEQYQLSQSLAFPRPHVPEEISRGKAGVGRRERFGIIMQKVMWFRFLGHLAKWIDLSCPQGPLSGLEKAQNTSPPVSAEMQPAASFPFSSLQQELPEAKN